MPNEASLLTLSPEQAADTSPPREHARWRRLLRRAIQNYWKELPWDSCGSGLQWQLCWP